MLFFVLLQGLSGGIGIKGEKGSAVDVTGPKVSFNAVQSNSCHVFLH